MCAGWSSLAISSSVGPGPQTGASPGVGLSLGVLGGSSLTMSSAVGPGPQTRSVVVLCLVQVLVLGCCHWVCWVGAH